MIAADPHRALLDGVDRRQVGDACRRGSARMFKRLVAAVRIATPILILVAMAIAGEAGQRWMP